MRFRIILNRDGGTLKTLDLDQLCDGIRATLEEAGHTVQVDVIAGPQLEDALDAAARARADVVMAGGGDGTISAAAARLKGTSKALAILPAGTMNLFARSLGIPLKLDEAVKAFATGVVRDVDLASANDRVFVHQFSIGLHAKLIRLREKEEFQSRFGKMRASARAGFGAFMRPPRMRVGLVVDGEETTVVTSGIGVTNNLFGEGHLPYADDPAGGVLGVYITRAKRRRDLAKFVANMAIGRWQANDQVDILGARRVTLSIGSSHSRFGCAVDGELCPLSTQTELRLLPKALKVLVPAA